MFETPNVGALAMLVAGWEGADTVTLGDIIKAGPTAYPGILAANKTKALIDTAGKTLITA